MIYCKNKKAKWDYEIIETLEVGLKLNGSEVKSIREGKSNLKGSWVSSKNRKQLLLKNYHVSPYNQGYEYIEQDPLRNKELLLHAHQRDRFLKKSEQKGYTLLILSIYQPKESKNLKGELALCKGKNKADKRRHLKEQDLKRQIQLDIKDN